MKVMLFGGTGFVGKRLQVLLKAHGHEVALRDVRRDRGFAGEIGSYDAVVNLAGAPLFGKRWSAKYKELLYNSRIEGTRAIVDAIGEAHEKGPQPGVLVNASAIGYYGDSLDDSFDETSEVGPDFLSRLCHAWEEEAFKAKMRHRTRTVVLRLGIVLGAGGGALAQLLPPFKAFLGGPIGNGKQWTSWIHIDDVCGLILHAIEKPNVEGVLNAVAPHPVTNREFTTAIGQTLGRPTFLPVPKLGLYALIGEAASIVAGGQYVKPTRTVESGYTFKFPFVKDALANAINGTEPSKLAESLA